MKRVLLCLIALAGLLAGLSAQELSSHQQKLDDIRLKYAPDKRVKVFTVKAQLSHDTLLFTGDTDQPEAIRQIELYLKSLTIPYTNQVRLLPAAELGDKTYGIVSISSVTIHAQPDVTEELTNQSILGTPVRILKSDDGYLLIQTPDEYIGWAEASVIYRVTPAEYRSYLASNLVMYTGKVGWIHQSPDPQSPLLSDIVMTSLLTPLGVEKGWTKVKFPDGRVGYLPSGELVDYQSWKKQIRPTRERVIDLAKQFMGVPYLWGGCTAKMLDCSGLAQTCYKMNNIQLPRDASQQCFVGDSIPITPGLEYAKPADLMFFGRYDSLRQREIITHVGIYLGKHAFIHEATDVHINSLHPDSANFSERRLKQLRRIRRIIPD
ncbi:MAG: C40 family peptidase [Candidatus Delongbacteria bacterium]|nr:C40 family peptidase [Candidatus Delongbacteria bacterium]